MDTTTTRELEHLSEGERTMVRALVDAALTRGCEISVKDGSDGEWVLRRSRDRAAILAALGSTGDDVLSVWRGGVQRGWIWLVYGNSAWEVIADYSCKPLVEELYAAVEPVAIALEAGGVPGEGEV